MAWRQVVGIQDGSSEPSILMLQPSSNCFLSMLLPQSQVVCSGNDIRTAGTLNGQLPHVGYKGLLAACQVFPRVGHWYEDLNSAFSIWSSEASFSLVWGAESSILRGVINRRSRARPCMSIEPIYLSRLYASVRYIEFVSSLGMIKPH